jgi:hypothetical protein
MGRVRAVTNVVSIPAGRVVEQPGCCIEPGSQVSFTAAAIMELLQYSDECLQTRQGLCACTQESAGMQTPAPQCVGYSG